MIGELTEAQMDHMLRTECVARIGCYDGDRTYVVPISYVFDEGFIYAHSGQGLKIEIMRSNPEVCVEIDHVDDLANWQSVIAWGSFEEMTRSDREEAMALLVGRLTPLISERGGHLPHPWDAHGGAADHILYRASRHGVVYRIRLTEKTGMYEARPPSPPAEPGPTTKSLATKS